VLKILKKTVPTYSVVEPQPDFFAGAGAGKKAPAPALLKIFVENLNF